jgi:hypothetical protein
VDGPTIDVSVTPPATVPALSVDGGRVESGGGWVRVVGAGPDSSRRIGPGVALAATRSGRFIVALAPDSARREYDP